MLYEKLKPNSVRNFTIVLCFFLISRIGIYTMTYFGYNLFPKYTERPQYTQDEKGYTRLQTPDFVYETHFPSVKDFIKFDSGFYLRIAERGYDTYRMDEPHPAADWPFFPLYPMLIRLVCFITPLGAATAAMLLSNIFGFLGIYLIYLIARSMTGEDETARSSILYMLIYPASIYLSMAYTESLFIFLSALSVYLYMNKKTGWSILAASLSTVTRIPGIANLFFIAFCMVREAKWNFRSIPLKRYVQFVLSGVPLLTFFTYMYFHTGDFLAVFHELSLNWGRSTSVPFLSYIGYFFYPSFVQPGGWDLGLASFLFTTFALAVYIRFFRSRRWDKPYALELAVYGLVLVLIPLSSASYTMTSVIRYYMASFPLFILMAMAAKEKRLLDFAFTTLFFSFNVIYTIAYINEYFFVV